MASKKNPDLKDMLKYAGFAIEIFKVLAHAVLALGGTIEQMRRLLKEPQLVRQIAQLIVPAAEELPPGYSSVDVYAPGLTLEEFESRFPEFLGKSERMIFCAIPYKEGDDMERMLLSARANGLRPANRREAASYCNEVSSRTRKLQQLLTMRVRHDGVLVVCDIAEGLLGEDWIGRGQDEASLLYQYQDTKGENPTAFIFVRI